MSEVDTNRERRLEGLSRRTGIPFDILAERYDRGIRGLALTVGARPEPSRAWLTTEQAADLLAVSPSLLTSQKLDVQGALRRRVASYRRGVSARHIGWLWAREDLERVVMIRRECQISTAPALRVLAALKEGRVR